MKAFATWLLTLSLVCAAPFASAQAQTQDGIRVEGG